MVKRYIWSFAEKFGQGLFVSDKGDYVKYDDYAALQQKLDAMVAENAALKESVEHAAGCIHAAEVEGLQDALESRDSERLSDLVHRRLCHAYLHTETPATDAYLNSVRAEGVAMFAEELGSPYGNYDNRDYETGFNRAIEVSKNKAIKFANQLRSGTHDTVDKARLQEITQ